MALSGPKDDKFRPGEQLCDDPQMKIFILFISFSAMASEVVIIKDYYDGLGKTFRKEKAVTFDSACNEILVAQKIFLDSINELREVSLYDKYGRYKSGAGKDNYPEVHQEVNEIFDGARPGKNPCEKKEPGTGSLQ